MKRGLTPVGALLLTLTLTACPTKPPDLEPPDGNGNGNGGGGSAWSTSEVVATGGEGHQIAVATLEDGEVAIAFYAAFGENAGDCDGYGIENPPDAIAWRLSYATHDGTDWAVELVAEPYMVRSPEGLELVVSPAGTPTLVTPVGQPVVNGEILFCGANDSGFYERGFGGWSFATVAEDSDEAFADDPVSDFGYVVGMWPSLAYGPSGQRALAWMDIHAGSLQGDDYRKSDLEVAIDTGSGWQLHAVDFSRGAGSYTRAIYDADGTLYLVHHNPNEDIVNSPRGLWVVRTEDDGDTWEQVHLHTGGTAERPSVALDADGRLLIAYYDAGDGSPRIATLVDPEQFTDRGAGWSTERVGDVRYDEGYFPSLAVDADGNVALAYYRCGLVANGLGNCDPNEDAAVFAWKDGTEWQHEVIEEGATGVCGRHTSLTFDGDNEAVVAWQCSIVQDEVSQFQVLTARRDPLDS